MLKMGRLSLSLPFVIKKNMANFKIIIQYDGTRYKGWQRQKTTDNTIQGKLESILLKQFGRTIEIDGSGRTDAGVHAAGQVANFRIPESCMCGQSPEEMCDTLMEMFAQYLPEDIAVSSVRVASERFHSRLNAVKKTYIYRIWNGAYPNVFERKYMVHRREHFDVDAMRRGAEFLLGQHDFAAFCGNAKMKKSTVRNIENIQIERIGEEIRFTYTGNGFLQNMVRIVTGTLVDVGLGVYPPEHVAEILEGKLRSAAGPMMPSQGLILWEVNY